MAPAAHYFTARSLPWIFALCAVTACSNSNSAAVQTPAPLTPDSLITETPTTSFTIRPEPVLPPSLPQAGAKVTDPTFGTTLLRLTDGADGNTEMGVQYSYWPVFNRNSTRIHVNGKYGPRAACFLPLIRRLSLRVLPSCCGQPLRRVSCWSAPTGSGAAATQTSFMDITDMSMRLKMSLGSFGLTTWPRSNIRWSKTFPAYCGRMAQAYCC